MLNGSSLKMIPVIALVFSGLVVWSAEQDTHSEPPVVQHGDCTFFTPQHREGSREQQSAATEHVTRYLASTAAEPRSVSFQQTNLGLIDRYLYQDMQANRVRPAAKTTDYEFIRRVTLDLTGRIPAPERVLSFVADGSPDKRSKLIDALLNTSEWVDKWTMFFGDLYKNNVRNHQIKRSEPGRNAFYKWIRDSLAAGKPYDQMVREILTAQGSNSFQSGEINWMVGGVVTGGPRADIIDQQAANVAETFLGIAHMHCVLCHSGRGHLQSLSLWGRDTSRFQAWGFASFLSHTKVARLRMRPDDKHSPYYWSVLDDQPDYTTDYELNTTTGNRPPRQPINGQSTIAPLYPFSGKAPKPGENYRIALAREVTSDVQFARTLVNYVWKQFFGLGIVEPANQFDPARLDPDHPPPDPWTLQPTNARLLNGLAQEFINGGYSLKALMRELTNSEAYQLSSRYDGAWDPAWEKFFARKFVRRLWAEEIHDAIVQSSGSTPEYRIPGFSNFDKFPDFTVFPQYGPVQWAMRFPDVNGMPDGGGPVSQFLDSFQRGNRDDEERRADGSLLQALSLMNDRFVMSRIRPVAGSLLARSLELPDEQAVATVYLSVLSRQPTEQERNTAVSVLRAGNRQRKAEDLLWSLYNKVDFIFNY